MNESQLKAQNRHLTKLLMALIEGSGKQEIRIPLSHINKVRGGVCLIEHVDQSKAQVVLRYGVEESQIFYCSEEKICSPVQPNPPIDGIEKALMEEIQGQDLPNQIRKSTGGVKTDEELAMLEKLQQVSSRLRTRARVQNIVQTPAFS